MQKIKIAVRFLHIFSVYYMQIVILCMQLNFVIIQGTPSEHPILFVRNFKQRQYSSLNKKSAR